MRLLEAKALCTSFTAIEMPPQVLLSTQRIEQAILLCRSFAPIQMLMGHLNALRAQTR
jgi:hypothetical protein